MAVSLARMYKLALALALGSSTYKMSKLIDVNDLLRTENNEAFSHGKVFSFPAVKFFIFFFSTQGEKKF